MAENNNEIKISRNILFIRGEKVILDFALAELYQVETKVLKQSVKRNIKRFPSDFMFELNDEEFANLRSQFVTSSWGGLRYKPFAFTEQGVAMLSSVLKSDRAIEVNIGIMRTFVQLRKLIETNKDLSLKIDAIESRYDEQFKIVFDAIRQLMSEEIKPKKKIGFK